MALSEKADAVLEAELAGIRSQGTWKSERVITTPQGARVNVAGNDVLVLCSNDYLGLANHPALVAGAQAALERWGYGLASVRFICGTQAPHKELEQALSEFLGTEDAILYSSCFDANAGLFETLLGPEDAVISDELNHASIIDGIRLCKAQRLRYRHGDMEDLAARLRDSAAARLRLVVTDGVFSMDGHLANLPVICDLAERHGALVVVDDSHGVGVMGARGRGTHEHHGVMGRVDILTGTLGKALGGASGGYTSGRRRVIDLLRQRSRPYLFSNTLPPPIVGGALAALRLLAESTELRDRLARNTRLFRSRLEQGGFEVAPGEHPIVPIMLGDAALAGRFAEALLDRGIYVAGFSFPVVPRGQARIRTQVSAHHGEADLRLAVEKFAEVRRQLLG
jgi:glycine C-acetyltransferase